MRNFTFKWPHAAEEVYVTGTFDNWTKSQQLTKVGPVFEKTVTLPDSSEKIYYKFVVDGTWTTDHVAPQEKDHEGNENNVLLPGEMDQLEEASQAAVINNLVPESTTAQLAAAVPLEGKKEDKQDEKLAESEAATSNAAILNSAHPESTTAQLAGAVPLEKQEEEPNVTAAPGGYPETPAAELDKEVKVNPLPATDRAVNPVKLAPGEEVPTDLTAGGIDSHVTLDKESYEQSDRIPGLETTLPYVTGNMIPESSLPVPVVGANDATIHSAAPEATTVSLAGQVPLEQAKVPEIVKQSHEAAHAEPKASASGEEVQEKAAVEEELLQKVAPAPSTSEGTAGKGTEKSETDGLTAEKALDAATSAGEMALGAAITAGSAAAGAATKAGSAAADIAAKAGEAAIVMAAKATLAAPDAASRLTEAVKSVVPGAAPQGITEEEKKQIVLDSVSSEVPAEVRESIKEAEASPEAAVNTAAVEEKKEYEAELLEKVKPVEAVGESSTKAAEEPESSATESKPAAEAQTISTPELVAALIKPIEEPAPAEVPQAETKPKPIEEGTAQAVEPPAPVEAIKTLDEAKPAEAPTLADTLKLPGEDKAVEETTPAATALAVEPPKPVETIKLVDEPVVAESSKAAEEPKPLAPLTAVEAPSAVEAPEPAAEASKPAEQPATNGAAATAASSSTSKPATDGTATSEKKKKHRISGFFNKLKHKFN